MIRESGLDAALKEVCGIDPTGELAQMVKREYAELKKAVSIGGS